MTRTPHNDEPAQVVLSARSPADAEAVFSTLRSCFASDRAAGDTPHDEPNRSGHPMVWTENFETSEVQGDVREGTQPAAAVTVNLQGSPLAVDRLREVLTRAFAVRAEGTVSGDQEVELQLVLESPDNG
ncbi:hypothetical protein ADK86_09635 [Streptomyces sp. NRRL F-5755]|uniref:hypothetical protein n=1 Tax=Streptomyces sp. NRRL F-5755 TaxID=1519475 RepID=UPI0006AEFB7E|nr:hypothetical protein [Streptomyces sp. NRRL F-5755]KOU03657.1 hypothetical protein ADK86_09635 [Streptomyces sp. NRRL F-5755]